MAIRHRARKIIRRVLAAHHADKDIERGPGMTARQRADFRE